MKSGVHGVRNLGNFSNVDAVRRCDFFGALLGGADDDGDKGDADYGDGVASNCVRDNQRMPVGRTRNDLHSSKCIDAFIYIW